MRRYIYQSIKGINHRKNEDDLLIIEEKDYQLFLIFDGVGSAENSKLAIKIAKTSIQSSYKKYYKNGNFQIGLMMFDVNNKILNSNYQNALTTYCAIFISYQTTSNTKISNLGDSRIYGITNQFMDLLSTDDNLIGKKNVLTKCLGMKNLSLIDFREEELASQYDKYLLCSDGFYSFLDKAKLELFEIFNKKYSKTKLKNLDSILKGKNVDDATYILIE
jgi:serine/threonine protein phosphatase PrpC